MPEVALARRGQDVRLTFAALSRPDDDPQALLGRLESRAAGLRQEPLPMLDPHPVNSISQGGLWGDSDPVVTDNVVFADNYWRADGFTNFRHAIVAISPAPATALAA